MAGKPNRTSRIARFAGLAITVAGMAFATASWAGITSSENPSTDGSYTISWSAVPNAHSHQLYEDGTLVYDSTGTSWSASGKAAGDYEYTVGYCEYIFDEEMCFGSGYTALTVTVSPPAPGAPTLTAPATDADGSYTVSWTASTGASSYKLEEKPAGGSFSSAYDGAKRSHKITGKTAGIYEYRVQACAGSDNCGDWSSTKTTKVPPGKPTLTVPATDSDGDYTVSWTAPSGATSYELEEKPAGGSFSSAYDGDGTSQEIEDNTPGIYTYRVRACAGSGNCGRWSSTKTTKVPPGKPTLTVPATDSDGDYTVSWTAPSGATSYELEEKPAGGSFSSAYDGDGTSQEIEDNTPGIYTYRVRACAGSGNCGRWSSTKTTKVPPGKPTLTVPATDSDGDYTVSWTAPSGATSYELEEKPAGGRFANVYDGDSTSESISDKPDGTYSYRARACAGTGNCSDWSSTESVAVERPPGAPTLTVPATDSDGRYKVSWTSVSGSTSYELEEKPAGGSFSNVYDGGKTSKTITGKADGTYSYRVRACKSTCGSWSSTESVVVEHPPGAPTLTVPATDSDGDYTVSWTSPPGATSYKLEEKSGSGNFANVYSGANTSASISDKADGTYSYRVRACNSTCGSWSSTKSVVVEHPPAAPTLTVPATDSDGDYTVSWTSPSGATSYKLEEKSGSGNFANIYSGSDTSRNIKGKADGTYSYRVRACNSTCGSWSSTKSVVVEHPPAAPTLTVPTTDRDGDYTVSWTSVSGATSYKLEEKSGSGSFANIYSGSDTSRSITDKADGAYSYRVRACTSTCGDWSSTATVNVVSDLRASPNPSADGSYTVSWTPIPNAESYQLYEDGTLVYDSTGTTWSFSGKVAGSYEYTLEFCELIFDEEHCDLPSGYESLTVTVTTPPLAPTLTVPATDADGSYTASWTESAGATSYKLEEKAAGGSFSNVYDGANRSHGISGKAVGIYMYRVQACAGSDNCGDWSETKTTKVPPGVPTLTVPATDADGTYKATWTSPTGATRYELQQKVGSGMWSESESLTATTKNYTGKTPAIYMYRVRACAGSDNCGDWSETKTTKVPPGTPKLTVPATNSGGSYAVTWTSPSGATGYELEEKSGSGNFGNVHNGSAASKNITGKTDGTYGYRVRACAGAGNCGGWSSTKTVRVGGDLTASPNPSNDGSYTVSWSAIPAAESYDLFEDGVSVYHGTETTRSFSGKAAGSYTYTLEFCELIFDEELCDIGSGYAALTVTVTTPPLAPTLTVPATDADGRYDATWTSPTGATSYELQEKVGSGMWSESESLMATTKTYTGKTPAIYMYRVRACAGTDNCGDWSATGTTKVPPAAPKLTVPAMDSDGSYDAMWTSPTGATSYELQEKVGSGMWSESESLMATTKTYTGKTPAIYMYRVRACAGTDNCGDWSATGTTKVPPAAPKLTVPATDADGNYTISWMSVPGATSYKLEEKPPGGSFSHIYEGDDTSYEIASKTAGIYMYRIQAGAGTGNCGDWSSTKTIKVPPGMPTLTVPATDADGSYAVTWTSLSGATSYELEEKPASGSFANVYSGSGTSTDITGKADGTYSYRVRACAGTGNCGAWSTTKSVTVERPLVSPNNPPLAVDDAAETTFGTPVEIAVLENDTDVDGDDLTVMSVTTPRNGTVAITSDDAGNNTLVTYTPGSRHPGSDTFDYTVYDGTATDTGTVEVTVGFVKVTPNPSTTGNYTLSWQGTLQADRYRVSESVPGGEPLWSDHSTTSVEYTGKAAGEYSYVVLSCHSRLGDEMCEEYGRVTARVVLPITPGNLPYRSGVTKGGDAYVNVPIAPVPGVNGLAPRLSIDYSGGRERHRSDQELPADMIGYGWRVGGFSAIRRCVKGTDDSDGISFDDTDELCLDGEPLEKIKEGTENPKVPPEYRTARESFAKVLLIDNETGDWFEVHLPDGTVREYGRTLDSQLWKPARQASGSDPAEPAAPFLWSINKQTDAFGNLMQYEYYEDNTNLARHPKKITYGNAKDATIEFVYKPRDDLDSTQVGSFSLGQPQRLTYIHLRLGGSLVRDYRLAYKRTSTGQVRLNELQTCGYEPSGTYHCLSPLAIGWQGAASGTWVNQLTDPMGVETTFAIETMSESDPHSFVLAANDTPFGTTSLPANTRALPAKNDTVKPVVTGITRSDGIGGTRRTSYAYLGRGVENTRNWGFLGFHAIRETDGASGIVTYTQYRLDHPHFGRPAQVVRYHGNYIRPTSTTKAKTPLSKRAVRYAEKSVAHTGSTVKTTLPYAEETMEWLYEGTSTLGAVRTTETLTLPSRFVTKVVRETRTGHAATGDGDGGSDWGAGQSHTLSGIQRTTQQTLSFDNDEANWALGFVNNIGVNHYGPNSGDTRGTLNWTETVGRTRIAGTLAPDVVTRFPGDDLQHRTDYGYDTKGNRKTASETEGVPASNAGGQSSQTADDSARIWEVLGFGAGRFPTSWKNPLNHREYATHHVGLGVPATTTDANNRRTSYAYDGLGREISRTRHWDSVTTTKDGVTTTEDVKTTTAYAPCDDDNTCDAVEATIAGCGTRYSVAPVMKVTTSAPDMPDSTAYLDMFGRAIRTAVEGFDGTDRRVDAFYDARGRMVCESEPYHAGDEARYTRYAYDIRDRLTRAARPDGGTTGIMYAAASNRVTATVTETVMATNGNETLATRKTKRTHNVLGELVSTVEGAAEAASKRVTTSYVYDGAGRLETVTIGDQTTTFAYDAAGNRASVKNPNLGATVNAGDDTNRVPVSVKFAYNGHGELTERTDARGATHYGYDKLGRRTCAADRGGTATWEYDPANGRGLLKRRGYDRDTVRTSASNCPFGDDFAETYTYNDDARLETVTTSIVDDANATTTLTRRHAYDDYGRLASTTYPSSAMDAVTVGYEYNEHGYRSKLKHGETALVEVKAQTAYGQSRAENYGNGVRTRRDYDKLGRLKDTDTIRRGGATIQDNTYAWRSDGSLQRRAARAGSQVKREFLDYDYLNRLTSAATRIGGSATASRTLTFGYDLRGNLKTRTSDVSGDDNVTSAYPETSNRLISATVGDVPYTFPHDTSGHIEQYECKDPDENDEVDPCADVDDTFIDWNARGLAEKVTVGESKTADTPAARDSFRYGPDGARYFKKSEWTVGSGAAATLKTSRKYYAGAYEKTVTAGGETVERTRIGDSVVHVRTTPASMMASAPPPVFEYVHRDHLGSVEAVTDQAGNELIVLAHDPYGERRKKDWTGQLADTEIESLLSAHGERVSRGFTRHEHLDRTGLIHMNGRMYDPRLGRFLSPDPIVGDPTSSRSWNLYSYVRNNPFSYVDPTGELEILIVTASRCDWVCWEDTHYWLDWWDASHGWRGDSWDISPWDSEDSYDLAESIRADAENTLDALDKSVADQPINHDRDALWASIRVYFDDTGGLLDKEGIPYDPQRGFAAALYKINGHYYLVFRGTQGGSFRNWWANLRQALGFPSSQYKQAIELAQAVYQKLRGNVTFVGHSLGGGLASAARFAIAGSRAITFNAAGLHSRYRTDEPGEIRAHHIRGDPLSVVQDLVPFLPEAAGTRIEHPYQYNGPFWERHSYKAFPLW
ncbi:MAG: Ig-like domain-containing protein [Gammaproteobacteria bacterium]|nr:Ig-like domain-containing protein [Gammaproteobacteria bacterium]